MIVFSYIRILIRAPIALLWTLFVHFFFVRLPQLFTPGKRYTKAIGMWGRGLAFIMGVRIHKQNKRTGEMGDLIISNHMGFLDIPVILSVFPAVFVIKMEMRRVFFFGKALEQQGHVFVDRQEVKSRHSALKGLQKVLKAGDRIVNFPEGGASPDAKRPPFTPLPLVIAKRLGKRVEACAIDYLPDRSMLKWDASKPMFGQLVTLFGRGRTDISIAFFPSEIIEDAREATLRYHDLIQSRLELNDREREAAMSGQL